MVRCKELAKATIAFGFAFCSEKSFKNQIVEPAVLPSVTVRFTPLARRSIVSIL